MINLVIGILCTAVAFLPPLDWLSCFGFFLGWLNISVGIALVIQRGRA